MNKLPADVIVCSSFSLTLVILRKLNAERWVDEEAQFGLGWRISEEDYEKRRVTEFVEYKTQKKSHHIRGNWIVAPGDVPTGLKIPVKCFAKPSELLKKRVIGFVPIFISCYPAAIRTPFVPHDTTLVDALDI